MIQYLNPVSWLKWGGQFVSGWLMSFPVRDTPKSFPAVALILLLVVCTIAAYSQTSDWRGRLLDRQLNAAFAKDDFGTAELVLTRQLEQKPNDTQVLFRLGVTKDALGEEEEATELMQRLVDIKQDEQAARWLLDKNFLSKNKKLDVADDEADEFGRLLTLVHKESPQDLKVKQLLVNYLMATKDYNKAVPLLDDLSRYQPMRGLQAAALSKQLGNTATANRLANRTLETVQKLYEEEPTNPTLALAVAQAQLFLEQHSDAVQTLYTAIGRARKDDEKRTLSISMGDAIVAWVAFLENSGTTTSKDRVRVLKMLQVALRYAPNNPRVVSVIADQVLATMNENSEEMAALRKALVAGTSPGIAHFLRGTAALMQDKYDIAERELELAAKDLPKSGAILNNLAVVIALKEDGDLERALKISEMAIKQTPGASPHFFETRGQILFRMKKYEEAIPDLEHALIVDSLAKNAHKSLAVCYDELGDTEIADMHREGAEDPDSMKVDLSIDTEVEDLSGKAAEEDEEESATDE
jgi:tetratricopeptide (TPR) repeat protein